jgi:ABC-2 type transport system ATP-binding protein
LGLPIPSDGTAPGRLPAGPLWDIRWRADRGGWDTGRMSDVLRARGLLKTYRRGRAVDGVDLTVRRGERVALLGPNGAGKTTTLLMCLGVVEPDGGTVEIVGHRLPRGRSAAMAHVGFAAGYLPLPERLRVGEFLRMFGQLYGLADPDAQALRGLERFGIPQLAGAMGTELSSGQKTLVGIVKATMHDPELLVLDEPTASLDPDVALRVRTGLAALCEERGTALLVTSHNMVEVFLHLASARQASEHTEGLRP